MLAAIAAGTKIATSSLVIGYVTGDPLPRVGADRTHSRVGGSLGDLTRGRVTARDGRASASARPTRAADTGALTSLTG